MPDKQRWKLIPPSAKGRSKSKSKSRSSSLKTGSHLKGDCCKQRSSLFRAVIRLSGQLAKYRAKDDEMNAKKEKNKTKRTKAVQRRKEITVLAEAADKTIKAIARGEHVGTYDKFMNSTVTNHYGYNDAEFERITMEILKGTVASKNPPKAAVQAVKKVETLVVKSAEPTPMATRVVNNVQNLVKKKKIA